MSSVCEFEKISMSLAFGITKEVLIKLRYLPLYTGWSITARKKLPVRVYMLFHQEVSRPL
jgi:hypothetical protein